MIIIVVSPTNKHSYSSEMEGFFRLRKAVFADQLGWDVPCHGDLEIDDYDALDPIYILSLDSATRAVRGGLRLMPTTGPHLMQDIFASWFEEDVVFQSASIWEVTRFCVGREWQKGPYTQRGINLVTSELLVALCELSQSVGLTQLTGLCHAGMIHVLRRSKWAPEIVATSDVPATGRVYLGLWDVSSEVLQSLKEATGIETALAPFLLSDPRPLAA